MNFVQLEFVGFMATMFIVYWLLKARRWQNGLLVAGSALFYGWVHPWFLVLLYTSALLDFMMGQAIVRSPHHKRWFLGLSLAGNLGMLAWFKYFDFFVANISEGLVSLGLDVNLQTLNVFLPVGISFYTFQTMSYTIDVYRGELKPRRDLLNYLVYISFFPQLVAGPIERAGRLLPQVEAERVFRWATVRSGLSLALWGAFKKVCIADVLAPYVDKVFLLEDPAGPVIWAGTIAFMLQIYSDFSGYTDIARGTARMLGFELVENFRSPYLAASTPEFWQRWHMSLSTWIRDYIMAPLLGSGDRISLGRFAFAVMLTFLAIGAWHGASWNYLLFGLFHGLWMCIYSGVQRIRPAWFDRVPAGRVWAIGFHLVFVSLIGSLIFREPQVSRIFEHLQKHPFAATVPEWTAVAVLLGLTATGSLAYLASGAWSRWIQPRVEASPWLFPVQTTAWALAGLGLFVFYRLNAIDFVYFTF